MAIAKLFALYANAEIFILEDRNLGYYDNTSSNKTDHIFLLRDFTMLSALIFCFLCIIP